MAVAQFVTWTNVPFPGYDEAMEPTETHRRTSYQFTCPCGAFRAVGVRCCEQKRAVVQYRAARQSSDVRRGDPVQRCPRCGYEFPPLTWDEFTSTLWPV